MKDHFRDNLKTHKREILLHGKLCNMKHAVQLIQKFIQFIVNQVSDKLLENIKLLIQINMVRIIYRRQFFFSSKVAFFILSLKCSLT